MTNNYEILVKKINKFIKKYYLINFLHKFIFGVLIATSLILVDILANYFFYFNIPTKKAIFFLTLILLFALSIQYFLIPLAKLLNILPTLDIKSAAKIISKLEPSFKDKIINAIDLANQNNTSPLVLASIDQKISQLKFLDFNRLLKLKYAFSYFKYLLALISFILIIQIFKPSILSSGSKKFIKYNQYFAPPPPFSFNLLNQNLKVKQGDDFTVKVKLSGKQLPQNVFISINNNLFLMPKKNFQTFYYKIKHITKPVQFFFIANKFHSKIYSIKVIPAPKLISFSVKIIPPKYTKIPSKTLSNITTFKVPYGSKLLLSLITQNIDSINLKSDSTSLNLKTINNKTKTYLQILKPTLILFTAFSENIKQQLLSLAVSVIPDQFPKINVSQFVDTNNLNIHYFVGHISDDYGFSKLIFKYQVNEKKSKSITIPINKNITSQPFAFSFDFSQLNLAPGDNVSYYFVVYDNDFISHFKPTKSQIFFFHIPSPLQLAQKFDSTQNSITNNLFNSEQLTFQISQQIQQIQEQLLNSTDLSVWQKKSMLKNLQDKSLELQNLLKQIQKQNKIKNALLNSFLKQNKNILQKQQQIQQIINSLLNDKLKKLLNQIQKLLNNPNNPNLFNQLKNLNSQYQELSQQLDQTLQMLKRLAIEQKIQQTSNELKNLAKLQDSLANITKNRKIPLDSVIKKQNILKNNLNKIQKNYQNILDQNKQLQSPLSLQNFKKQFQNAQQSLNKIQTLLNKNRRRKASKLQKQLSQQLNKFSQQLNQMLSSAQKNENIQNLSLIKKLFFDMLYISFQSENLIKQTTSLYAASPAMNKIAENIHTLKIQFNTIKDSLINLATRIPQINKPINTEIRKLNNGFDSSITFLINQHKNKSLLYMKMTMTSANNIALLLNDLYTQIQKMLQNATPSLSPKSGNKIAKLNSIINFQQQLQNQLEQLLKQLQQKHLSPSAKQILNAIQKEQLLEQMLQDFLNSYSISPKIQKQIYQIKKLLQQNKNDLLYNRLSDNILKTQQLIKVKLLSAQNALKTQGKDNKRVAQRPNKYTPIPPNLNLKLYSKYLIQKDVLEINSLKINDFYNKIYSKYLNSIK